VGAIQVLSIHDFRSAHFVTAIGRLGGAIRKNIHKYTKLLGEYDTSIYRG